MSEMDYEYKRFGDQIVRRASVDDEWEAVAENDVDAIVAVKIAEQLKDENRTKPSRMGIRITRAGSYE